MGWAFWRRCCATGCIKPRWFRISASAEQRQSKRCLLSGAVAAALFVLTLATFQDPSWYILSLIVWGLSMPFALIAVAPGEFFQRGPRSRTIGGARRHRLILEVGLAAVIMLCGTALRLVNLEGIPSGVHGDEVELGSFAVGLLHRRTIDPFGRIFLGDPAMFAFLQAPFIALAGQTITGLRLLGALSGVLTLPAFYLLIRSMFGIPTGLIAVALLAGNAAAVHFSRQALNVAEIPPAACLAWYCVCRGQRDGHAVWWLAAGMFAAAPLYFHFGGWLFPVLVVMYLAYLLLTQRHAWRAWIVGASWLFLGGFMALAPRLLLAIRDPTGAMGHPGSRLIFANWEAPPNSVSGVLLEQLRLNLLGFVNLWDASDFYTFAHAPLLAAVVWPLAAFGQLLALVRIWDSRYFLLAVWFWGTVLIGGVLTAGAPNAHRLLPAVLPALAVAAVVLGWLLTNGPRILGKTSAPVFLAGVAAVPIVAGWMDDSNYFGPAVAAQPYPQITRQATYIRSLGAGYYVSVLGAPIVYYAGLSRYLAPDVPGGNLQNAGRDLPFPGPSGRGLAFLIYPWMNSYLPLIQNAYPHGHTEIVQGRGGPLFTAYTVSSEDAAMNRGLTARYANSDRFELASAGLGGGAATYPSDATWTGGLYLEAVGAYGLQCAPVACRISVDDTALRGTRFLGGGWHSLTIAASLASAESKIALQWQLANSEWKPVPDAFLDARPVGGVLHAEIQTEGQPPRERVDRAIGFREAWQALGVGRPSTAIWRGSLSAPTSGVYELVLNTDSAASVSIHGQQVVSAQGAMTATKLALDQGKQPVEIRYRSERPPGVLELQWTPPGGQQSIIPPQAFGPAAF